MIGAITAGLFGTGVPPVTNSYDSIATVTVGSGGQSVVTFSSIPSTYKHLQIRTLYRNTSAQSNVLVRFNNDANANYSQHEVYGYGQPSPEAGGGGNTTSMFIILGATGTTNQAVGITDILEYGNTNINKTIRTVTGSDTNGGVNYVLFRSGNWRSTTAVNRIDLTASAGNFGEFSHIALYGIKG